MSFFASLGDSLNNAIENVGNIVAPMDDSFEEEDSYTNDYDSPAKGDHADGYEDDTPFSDGRLSSNDAVAVVAQQQEEIDFLRTKVESLAIELADRVGRENQLLSTVSDLQNTVTLLKEKNMDTLAALNKAQLELEESTCRLHQSEASLRALGESFQALQSTVDTAGSCNLELEADLNSRLEQSRSMNCAASAFKMIADCLLSVSEDDFDLAVSTAFASALGDVGSIEDLLGSWGTAECAMDAECLGSMRGALLRVGEALQQAQRSRGGWIAVAEACRKFGVKLSSECGVSLPSDFTGDCKYSNMEILLSRSLEELCTLIKYKQDAESGQNHLKDALHDRDRKILEAQSEIENLSTTLESTERRLNNSISEMKAEIESLVKENSDIKVSAAQIKTAQRNGTEQIELEESKREIKRMGHEMEQLHQVISQLRSARKSGSNQVEQAGHDRESLLTEISKLTEELMAARNILTEKIDQNNDLTKKLEHIAQSRDGLASDVVRLERDIAVFEEEKQNSTDQIAALQGTAAHLSAALAAKESELDAAVQELAAAKTRWAADTEGHSREHAELLSLRAEVDILRDELSRRQSAPASGSDTAELKAALTQIQKLEHEQRQLHQIISQLRQARKSSREDSDGAAADRASLKQANELLASENSTLKLTLSEKSQQLDQALRRLQETSSSYDSISAEMSRGEQENSALYQRLEEAEQSAAALSKQLFDSEARAETLQADLSLAKQDISFRDTELFNLQNAIDGLSREADRRVDLVKQEESKALVHAQEQHEKKLRSQQESYEQQISILQEELKEAQEREMDESLLRRKSELEGSAERKRLQAAVEQAMLRLQNSNEDVVDRAVIANLFVSYFKKNRSKEILDLIARMLCFTDEQKVTVGLMVAPRNLNPVGYLSSFIGGIVSGGANSIEEEEVKLPEGDSLAEMWVNFLLEESDKKPVHRGISSRSSSFSDQMPPMESTSRTSSFSTVSLSSPNESPRGQLGSPTRKNTNSYTSSFELSPPSPKVG